MYQIMMPDYVMLADSVAVQVNVIIKKIYFSVSIIERNSQHYYKTYKLLTTYITLLFLSFHYVALCFRHSGGTREPVGIMD